MNRYKLFFSWQSEKNDSRKLLETALQNAVDVLYNKGIMLEIDHSTLGVSGMPSIDQTILRKIDACDIFFADITPVYRYSKEMGNGQQITKEVPNPNVLLELGYAMSALGVGYVIVAAHSGGWVPANMPFDINHHSIYSFTSSNCDLSSHILNVIEYIKKNGSHRHLDKSYLVNGIEHCIKKLKKSYSFEEPVISEMSTVYFRRRMANAFPGDRGYIEFKKVKDIKRHLSKLLEVPIQFKKNIRGTNDPIWWFRGEESLDIPFFKHLGGNRFLIGWNEFKIRRIVAFIDNGRYYSNYVYVEIQGEKPTGLNKLYTPKKIAELKKYSHCDYVDEEYAIYKPCAFWRKKVTKQEEDDGSTKICGRLIKMQRKNIESRCRYLTDYNFLIAAKGSAFNNNEFSSTSGPYFNKLLDGTISYEEFHNYLMNFPKSYLDL